MGLTATGDAERLSRLAVPLLPEPQIRLVWRIKLNVAAEQRSRSTGEPWRVELDVPYEEREAVKAAGASWDAAIKRWIITNPAKLDAVERWWPNV